MTGRSRRTAAATRPGRLATGFVLTHLAVLVVSVAPLVGPGPGPGIGASPVAAQTVDEPSIRIIDQTTFVPADGVLHLVLDVNLSSATADPAVTAGEPELSVTFFGRLESEAGVSLPPTQPINRMAGIPVNRAPRTEAGHIHLAIPIRSSASFDDQERILLPQPGVYPVTVEVRGPDGPLAVTRTHLVRQPIETADQPTTAPVEVAMLLNVATAEGLTVSDATALLGAHPSVPMTVVLGQGVVSQLRGDPEATAALTAALAGRPVVTAPTIDLDPSAMAEIGQTDLYLAAARSDRQAVVDLGLDPAEGLALLSNSLTEEGVTVLRRLGVHTVLDIGDHLGGSGTISTGSTGPASSTGQIQVIRSDRDLDDVLSDDDPTSPEAGAVRANRALARLVLRQEIDDGVVVIGGPDLVVDPRPALDAFLRSLSQPGAPQPVPLDRVSGGPTLRLAEQPRQDLVPSTELVDRIRVTLDAYRSSHAGGGTLPDDYLQRLAAALAVQRNPDDRLRALTLLVGQIQAELGVIHIHQPQPVTLAARSATIPLVIDNNAPGPRQVVLRFRGDRVVAEGDGRKMLVQPGTNSLDIEVEARSLGVSPLEATVWSGDETVLLAEAQFEIRSTAVPGLGLLISLSALAMLGLWWIVDHRKRRRAAEVPPLEWAEGDETTEREPTTV